MVISVSLSIIKTFYLRDNPMFFRQYDYQKIRERIGPYVSSFKLKAGTLGIPVSKEKTESFLYDAYQTRLWVRLVYNELSDQDVRDLGIVRKDAREVSMTGSYAKQVDNRKYLKWGRMVSNASPVGRFPPKV